MRIQSNESILNELNEFSKTKHIGLYSSIKNLDNVIRFDKKRFNIITSNENQGKTTFVNYYCYMMAKTHGFKTLYLSFENDKLLFYSKLKRVFADNSFVEYSRYLESDEFKCFDDIYRDIDYYFENWGFDILVLDPFESLYQYMGGNTSSEEYAAVLDRMRQYCQMKDIILILAAHQKKLEDNEEPSVNKIFGSVSFGNKADNIISIRQIRPLITEIKALKVRHNLLEGIKGKSALFRFNPLNERFESISKDETDYTFEEFALQAHEKQDMGNYTAIDPKTLENENKAYLSQTKVSLYENFQYKNDISLNDALLLGISCKKQIDICRLLKSQGKENEYREEKKKLPSYTATATYKGERKEVNMTNYNALCVVDLDHLQDVEKAKEDIKKLPFVLYCAKSVGGKGLFCLIRVNGSKDEYLKHWYALKDDFEGIGLQIDESCKDLSRLRFVSYDTEPYINYQATIYNKKKITIPSTNYQATPQPNKNLSNDSVMADLKNIMEDVAKNHIQLSKNHHDTLYLSNVLSSVMGEDGRKYLHIIRQQREGYDQTKTDCLFDYSLEHNTTKYSICALRRKYKQARETAF